VDEPNHDKAVALTQEYFKRANIVQTMLGASLRECHFPMELPHHHCAWRRTDPPKWINLEDAFPNFAFAESFMNHLGRNGTVYMWATHESTILRQIRTQMDGRYENAQLLIGWIGSQRAVWWI
jgi:hypothetical protein